MTLGSTLERFAGTVTFWLLALSGVILANRWPPE